MTLDLETLLVASGLIIILCGIAFILNTAMRRNDASGRLWSIGFIAAMLTSLSFSIWSIADELWWVLAIGNTAYVISIGAIWSGARVFNGRPSLIWVVLAGGGLVALFTAIEGPGGGLWTGSAGLFAGVAVFAGLGGAETMRSRMRRNLNARIMSFALWTVCAYYVARTGIFVSLGPDSSTFQQYFSSELTVILTIVVVLLGTISMSILQAERSGARALGDVTVGVHSVVGVLSAAPFMQQWADWVERASFHGDRLAMIAMDVDNLPQMNTAFGRTFGDTAIRSVAQIVRHHAPTTALLGHTGAGRFVIVVVTQNVVDAEQLAIRLQTALVDEPIDPQQSLRATASFGVVDTDGYGYGLPVLRRALDDATHAAREAGGNSIVVGRGIAQPGA
ncbi:GGDEF domain-containing protein [Herbiconiux sp. KACC 21604]|uniref:GGDEF domain-containing protein n=1 Tax=unclassified Herbiconiux TaxID=2618217 RepID=UPI001491D4FD|nr:GGDEF domain-containing protein [Herbiconiux sp. SALV-R1]QJU54612.1 GGDEF domain-containing protein [Herbiconiux sp. SALV-R1]WPO85699.1 GGDEF domain-containing protein [Herbiconiux sp. KACC 21604]